jgi:hypothetical protein
LNDAPVGGPDEFAVAQSGSLTIRLDDVLANDWDPEGDPLEAFGIDPEQLPMHGWLDLVWDGGGWVLIYHPDEGFWGDDMFAYLLSDGDYMVSVPVTIHVTHVNQRPVAYDDEFGLDENYAANVPAPGVLGNDSDSDSDALTSHVTEPPMQGTLTLNADGGFSYVPDSPESHSGADFFRYVARDAEFESEPAWVVLASDAIEGPLAIPQRVTTHEDELCQIQLIAVRTAGVFEVINQPAHGWVDIDPWEGCGFYFPNPDYSGTDVFTFNINGSRTAWVEVTILPANDAPVATDDLFRLPAGSPVLTLTAATGVLANDIDIDGDTLTAELVSGPAAGTLDLLPDGSFAYTAGAGFDGSDMFTYQASDGGLVSTAVTVRIAAADYHYPPVAHAQDVQTSEDFPVIIVLSGSDFDSPELTYAVASGPLHGTLSGSPPVLTYQPAPGAYGTDEFTYTASDGFTVSAPATVSITVVHVNKPPVGGPDDFTVEQFGSLTFRLDELLANDWDPEGDALGMIGIDEYPQHGSIDIRWVGMWELEYFPEWEFSGDDAFSYLLSDGDRTVSVPVTIHIVRINRPPIAHDDEFGLDGGNATSVPAPGVLGNDTDPNGDALTSVITEPPVQGTLILNADGGFTYVPDSADTHSGADCFQYVARDAESESEPARVVLTSGDIGGPLAVSQRVTAQEDEPCQIALMAAGGYFFNIFEIITQPAHGRIEVNFWGDAVYFPDPDYTGTDVFTFRVFDSWPAPVLITIVPANDMPVVTDDLYRLPAGSLVLTLPGIAGVLSNDTDMDGDTITAELVSIPAAGTLDLQPDGSFTYTAGAGFAGSDTFTYQASDGFLVSEVATVRIAAADYHYPPVAHAQDLQTTEDLPVDLVLSGSDLDSPELTYAVASGPLHGILSGSPPELTYEPAAGYYGPDQFTFTASDGFTTSAPATVSITVVHVNQPPVGGPDEFTIEQSGLLMIRQTDLLANDVDPDGDPLEVGIDGEPMHGGIGFIWHDDAWVLEYHPEEGFWGDDSFTYGLSDGNYMVSVPVTIHVTHVNQAPVAFNDEFGLDESQAASVTPPGVLANDIDPDGDALTALITELPVQGTLTLDADGGFTYVPDSPEGHSGADGFRYVARDGSLQSNSAFVLLVSAASDGPLAVSQRVTTHENEPCQIQLLAAKTDGSEVFEIVAQPTHGWVEIDPWGEGDVGYFPNPDFYGDDLFTFRVGSSAPASVKIRVEGGGILRWRHDHFGTWDNAGIAADSADPDSDTLSNLQEFAFGTNPNAVTGSIGIDENGTVTNPRGTPVPRLYGITAQTVDFRAIFSRRKGFGDSGLIYTVEFSTLEEGCPWVASAAIPTLMDGSDAEIDVVYVPYPVFIQTDKGFEKPRFFRVGVLAE